MIERFRREVDWNAPDYRIHAAQLLKSMLLDYVRDYLHRGDVALIEYNDKRKEDRLAEEQRDLMASSSNDMLTKTPQSPASPRPTKLPIVENAIVWSKIKSGLKPVIAFNHIVIYKREQKIGSQILIASKQIYANHYFDSSLALTAFLKIPGAIPGSYLFYENRSRADGLGGVFSNLKRGMIERKALESVKAILHQSQVSLEARALNRNESLPVQAADERSFMGWRLGRIQVFLWLLVITALMVLFGLRAYDWKGSITKGTHP